MISPLIPFLAIQMASPGPNVVMLTTSAARFGTLRTLPHLAGVALGVGAIGAVSAAGIGAVLLAQPALKLALQGAAALWILWMAWGLFRSEEAAGGALVSRPMTWAEAVLFQWVNPKIWAIALAAASGYGQGMGPLAEALRMGMAFSGVNLLVCGLWTLSGSLLGRLLRSPPAWRRFRQTMALLLAGSAGLVFL